VVLGQVLRERKKARRCNQHPDRPPKNGYRFCPIHFALIGNL